MKDSRGNDHGHPGPSLGLVLRGSPASGPGLMESTQAHQSIRKLSTEKAAATFLLSKCAQYHQVSSVVSKKSKRVLNPDPKSETQYGY